ncbi:MAG: ribose 5-phosphate isomerase B [candidate division Zixibacteria bacterium]|nr:ribose 5-phosphate isomerase B [candidate division Zixibacteria bacterium]
MKIALGSDHKGFELKEKIKAILKAWGYEVVDFGTDSETSVDYSDYAAKVARSVAGGEVNRGVAVCWTGNGVNIAANKIDGVRATLVFNPEMAHLARAHNDSNVLTLSSKYLDVSQLEGILKEWLNTNFEGGRHARRLAKIPGSGISEKE